MKRLTILGVIALVIFVIYLNGQRQETEIPVACTMDAKICPDGSAVGRVGPRCEFAPCPSGIVTPLPVSVSPAVSELGTITGIVLLGPTCPVATNPPDPACDDKPYATRLAVTTTDQSRVITEFDSDTTGHFSVDVPPGSYDIRSAQMANVLPYCMNKRGKDPIQVQAGIVTDVTIDCDTGIR